MSILKIATEQAFAFLIGLILVTIIEPETAGGAILLVAIGMAAANVVITLTRLLFNKKEKSIEDDS
jgi:hypothetical protein